jgi:hypothetical protein
MAADETEAHYRPRQPSLIEATDVRAAIEELFDAGLDNQLVIRVYGETDQRSPAALDTFKEMLASLKMHDDPARGVLADEPVATPNRAAITKALSLLETEQVQRGILDFVLTTFGRKLVDPLAALLDRTPEGTLMARLTMLRDIFVAQVTGLHMTRESQGMISGDIKKLLSDDYLSRVAENEENVQRPRVRRLAQKVLQIVGAIFRAALKRFPERAESLVDAVCSRLPDKMRLKAIPPLVRSLVVSAVQNYLWEETSARLEAELLPLFSEFESMVARAAPAALNRDAYRELAEATWTLIERHC